MKRVRHTLQAILAVLFISVCSLANAQIDLGLSWTIGAWPNEPGFEIINTATGAVVYCEATYGATPATTATINVPPGTYNVRAYDGYGDGWDGSTLTVRQGTFVHVNAVTWNGAGAASNPCPAPVGGFGGPIIATFTVNLPTCVITCPAPITVSTSAGLCSAAFVDVAEPTTSGCTGIGINNANFAGPQTALLFNGTSLLQTTTTVTGPFTPPPTGAGNLQVTFNGDFDFSTESTNLRDENGNIIGVISGPQCGTATINISVTQAQLTSWAANGTMNFTLDANTNVNGPALCGAAGNFIQITVTYPTATAPYTNNINGGQSADGPYPLGTTPITFTALDPTGITVTCQTSVTVVDGTAPVLTCPPNQTFNLAPGECRIAVNYDVSAVDNCFTTPVRPFQSAQFNVFRIPDTTAAISADALSCGPGIVTNHYFQVMPASASSFLADYLRIGIPTTGAPAGTQYTVRLYTLINSNTPFNVTAANRVLLGSSATFVLPAAIANQRINIPIPNILVPAGVPVLVELETNRAFVVWTPTGTGTLTWDSAAAYEFLPMHRAYSITSVSS